MRSTGTFLLVLALVSAIVAGTPSSTIYATTPLYYVPIIIANDQSSAVATGTQVRIAFNPSLYSQLSSNLGNIRFFRANDWLDANRMYAWNENGTSSTQTNIVSWLKLTDPIPANSSITVYMALMPPSTDYDAIFWGKYGGWDNSGPNDNGQYVFNFYDHFGGTTLNTTNWPITQSCNRGSVVVGNAAGVFDGYPDCAFTGMASSIAVDPRTAAIDWLGYSSTGSETLSGFFVSSGKGDTAGAANARIYQYHERTNRYDLCNDGGSCVSFPAGPTTNDPQIYSIWADSNQSYMTMNYLTSTEVTNNVNYGATPSMGIMFNAGAAYNWVAWVRIRNQPPKDANPSSTFLAEASTATNVAETSSTIESSTTTSQESTISSSLTLTRTTTATQATTTQTTSIAYVTLTKTQLSTSLQSALSTATHTSYVSPSTTTKPSIGSTAFSISASTIMVVAVLLLVGLGLMITLVRSKRKPPTASEPSQPEPETTVPDPYETVDRIVLTYLQNHSGEISISKTAQELGITESELQSSLSRLAEKGTIQKT